MKQKTISGHNAYLFCMSWFLSVFLCLEGFRVFDWEHGITRFFLLIVLGSTYFLFRLVFTRVHLIFSQEKRWRRMLLLGVLSGLSVNIYQGIKSTRVSSQSGDILSDQAQTTVRAISLLSDGINPYGRGAVIDTHAYFLGLRELEKWGDCKESGISISEQLPIHVRGLGVSKESIGHLFSSIREGKDCIKIKILATSLGFKYGPVMLLSYLPFVYLSGASGIFVAHLLILLAFSLVLFYGTYRTSHSFFLSCFSLLIFLWPSHLGWSVFGRGDSDFFPTFLVILFYFLWSNKRFKLASICLGLSLSTKIFPGLLFLPLLIRNTRALMYAIIVAVAPYIPFLIWDYKGVFYTLFYNFVLPADSTSLAFYCPTTVLRLITVVGGMGCVGLIARAYRSGWNPCKTLDYLLLAHLVVFSITGFFHNNYLVWLLPVLSLYMTQTVVQAMNVPKNNLDLNSD